MNRDMLSRRLERREAGCEDYDTKPVNLKRLLGKIDKLLGAF